MGSTEKIRTSERSYSAKRGAPYRFGSRVIPLSLQDTSQVPVMPIPGDMVIKFVEFTGVMGLETRTAPPESCSSKSQLPPSRGGSGKPSPRTTMGISLDAGAPFWSMLLIMALYKVKFAPDDAKHCPLRESSMG
eukprot:scaffold34043_cov26-Tisochrysis_lutea.AAC.2